MNFLFLSILNLLYFLLNNCYFAVFYNVFIFLIFCNFLQYFLFFAIFFQFFYYFLYIFRILNLFYFFFHVLNNLVYQNFDNISEYYF